jgi:hypothetical protein
MNISIDQVLSTIDETIQQIQKNIAHFRHCENLHEDTIIALESRVRDYRSLRHFILTKDRQKHTSWVEIVIVDANRMKKNKKLFGVYSKQMLEIVLPYLAQTLFCN